jgi:hypothetical protein
VRRTRYEAAHAGRLAETDLGALAGPLSNLLHTCVHRVPSRSDLVIHRTRVVRTRFFEERTELGDRRPIRHELERSNHLLREYAPSDDLRERLLGLNRRDADIRNGLFGALDTVKRLKG